MIQQTRFRNVSKWYAQFSSFALVKILPVSGSMFLTKRVNCVELPSDKNPRRSKLRQKPTMPRSMHAASFFSATADCDRNLHAGCNRSKLLESFIALTDYSSYVSPADEWLTFKPLISKCFPQLQNWNSLCLLYLACSADCHVALWCSRLAQFSRESRVYAFNSRRMRKAKGVILPVKTRATLVHKVA